MRKATIATMIASACWVASCGAASAKQPIVFVIHGGGYVLAGSSATHDPEGTAVVEPLVRQFRRHGIKAIAVPYQAGDPGRATAQVVRFVRLHSQGRRAYAMGLSAGGGLAESLANRGLVQAAAALSPLSDLRDWALGAGWSRPSRLAASPTLGRSQVPILLEHSLGDPVVSYAQSRAFAARRHNVKLITDAGSVHVPLTHARLWPRGFAWLVRQIRSSRAS